MSETKRCSRCKEEKSRTEFHLDRSRPDGFAFYCRTCANAHTREWYSEHPFPYLARRAVARMKKRRILFDNSPKELAATLEFLWDCQGSECDLCGTEIALSSSEGRSAADAAHLDATDPRRPYELGNMRFLCAPCNNSKGDSTLEAAQRLYHYLREEVGIDH